MMKIVYLLIAGFSGFICLYAGFKQRQSSGKNFVNDVLTDVGGGSFSESLLRPLKTVFWIFICIASFICAMISLVAFLEENDKSKISTQNEIKITQPVINTVPTSETTKEVQKSSNETKTNTLEKAETISNITNNKDEAIKDFSEEEMQQLEKDKGYSGNDPIVRARLGLPPKE